MHIVKKLLWACFSTVVCMAFHHDVFGLSWDSECIRVDSKHYVGAKGIEFWAACSAMKVCDLVGGDCAAQWANGWAGLNDFSRSIDIFCDAGSYVSQCTSLNGALITMPTITSYCDATKEIVCAGCPSSGISGISYYIPASSRRHVVYVCSHLDQNGKDLGAIYMQVAEFDCSAEMQNWLKPITTCYLDKGKYSDTTGAFELTNSCVYSAI